MLNMMFSEIFHDFTSKESQSLTPTVSLRRIICQIIEKLQSHDRKLTPGPGKCPDVSSSRHETSSQEIQRNVTVHTQVSKPMCYFVFIERLSYIIMLALVSR